MVNDQTSCSKTLLHDFSIAEQKIAIAAKNVAEKIGGDVKQTEMELLSKLLKTSETKATKMELRFKFYLYIEMT